MCFGLRNGCAGVANDEGKYNGMEPNRRYGDDIICGPFFICGDDGGEFISLTDEQVEQYALQFKEIPQFTGQEPELESRMTPIAF